MTAVPSREVTTSQVSAVTFGFYTEKEVLLPDLQLQPILVLLLSTSTQTHKHSSLHSSRMSKDRAVTAALTADSQTEREARCDFDHL